MAVDTEVERAQKEYEHITAELARYHGDSQKLASFVSLVLTFAFVVGVAQKIEVVFPLVPLMVIALVQYLVANNYDYRIREQYVHTLERILRHDGGSVPRFYDLQIREYFVSLRWWELVLLPFNGSVVHTMILIVIVAVFSAVRAHRYLMQQPRSVVACYLVVAGGMLIYTTASTFWSLRKLRVRDK